MQCSQSKWEADSKSRTDGMSLTILNEKKEGMVLAIS